MCLELVGHLVSLNGSLNRGGSLIHGEWRDEIDRQAAQSGRAKDYFHLDMEIKAEMLIKITSAVYANIRFPGVGVPFYS
jgi:hypothetical protein